MLRYAGLWAFLGFGYWALEDKASGTFAGEMGFADFKREIEPSLDGMPELGWALAPQFHGRGYTTEALRAIVAWGDTHLDAKRTACIIHPENVQSLRVAEKLGYGEFQRTTYKGSPTVMFVRDAKIAGLGRPAEPKRGNGARGGN